MTADVAAAAGPRAGVPPVPPPFTGTRAERRSAVVAIGIAAGLVGLYGVAARALGVPPSGLEVLGTVTSLACVWITRSQNVLAMPLGLVSVVAMGAFFFDVGLVGQGWLHWGYYIPVQVWGWWHWARGGPGRSAAPVRTLSAPARAGVVLLLVAGTAACAWALELLHGPSPTLVWDSSIVAASVLAQALLSAKRVESWWLWLIPVDVSAIALYVVSGAYLFAALYVVFLWLAASGLVRWWRAVRSQG